MASSSSSSKPLQIPKFSGENFEIWGVKMRTFLQSEDLWEIVEIGYIEPFLASKLTYGEENQVRENLKKDAKALYYLQQGVSDDIFPKIMEATKAKQAWEILHEEFNYGNISSSCEEEDEQQQEKHMNNTMFPYAVSPPYAFGYPMASPYNQGHYPPYGPSYPMAYSPPPPPPQAYNNPAFQTTSQYKKAGDFVNILKGGKMKQVFNTLESTLGASKDINQPMAMPYNLQIPNSGAIIGPQFVAPYPLDLKITRKIFTVSEGNFSVTDMKGNSLFSVQGKFWTLHDRRTLLDAYGDPLVNFHQKTISLHDRWVAYKGESTRSQDKLFMAKRSSMVRLKKTLKVFLATSKKGDRSDFKIKGSWYDKSFIIYTGKTNIVIAEMHKNLSIQSLVLDKDNFVLTVHPNIDYAFIVSLLVMFDGIIQDDRDDGLVKIF